MAPCRQVTVAEIKEHIAFLRAVHAASLRGEGSLYVDNARLRAAARGYIVWFASHSLRRRWRRPVARCS